MDNLEFMTMVEIHSKTVSHHTMEAAVKDAINLIKEHSNGELVGLKCVEPLAPGRGPSTSKVRCMVEGDYIVVDITAVEAPTKWAGILHRFKPKYTLTYKRYVVDNARLQAMTTR